MNYTESAVYFSWFQKMRWDDWCDRSFRLPFWLALPNINLSDRRRMEGRYNSVYVKSVVCIDLDLPCYCANAFCRLTVVFVLLSFSVNIFVRYYTCQLDTSEPWNNDGLYSSSMSFVVHCQQVSGKVGKPSSADIKGMFSDQPHNQWCIFQKVGCFLGIKVSSSEQVIKLQCLLLQWKTQLLSLCLENQSIWALKVFELHCIVTAWEVAFATVYG